jgi:hypothetical protein
VTILTATTKVRSAKEVRSRSVGRSVESVEVSKQRSSRNKSVEAEEEG